MIFPRGCETLHHERQGMKALAKPIDRDAWRSILASAMLILDHLEQAGNGRPDLALGGGTVLMFRFQHRLSKDVDFFLHDVQWLSFLTPRLNDYVAAMVSDYSEQANCVKLILPQGDIDFIAATQVTGIAPPEFLDFADRRFALEATAEILAMKLLYRAAFFKPRHVFDLAACIRLDPDSARAAVRATMAQGPVLMRRLKHMAGLALPELCADIQPLGEFDGLVGSMVESVRQFVAETSSDSTLKP